jgi:purine-binding chemotaxis protein CheW
MAAVIKDLEQVNADLQEQKERVENVDFQMVTFSLSGKDYGVDIMNVKEIAKADKFTYVPNAASFIRGVYNLRGDIIPVIDLRSFFHLPVDKKHDSLENMLILHINDQVYGTIVDQIDKVVGINHEQIQPPHPIFGDINIKFIRGVVEKQGDLYVILDVMRIFTVSDEDKNKTRGGVGDGEYYVPPPPSGEPAAQAQRSAASTAIGFVQESLGALKRFNVTSLNAGWLNRRFAEWSAGRSGESLQLRSASEADEFLDSFASPCSGGFWTESYANAVKKVLPEFTAGTINVWNIGCGKGYETYSFACILKSRYPNARLKIWANDNDIMAVSQAPNMVFELSELPEYCREYTVHGPSGYSFAPEIKDAIVFEYHDVTNENTLPEMEIILARDVLSYMKASEQEKLIVDFTEKLKNRGVLFLGRNEEMTDTIWQTMADDPVSAFLHTA